MSSHLPRNAFSGARPREPRSRASNRKCRAKEGKKGEREEWRKKTGRLENIALGREGKSAKQREGRLKIFGH